MANTLKDFYLFLERNGIDCLEESGNDPYLGEFPENLMFNEEDFSPIEKFDDFIELLKEQENGDDVTKIELDFSKLKTRIDAGDDSSIDNEFIEVFQKEEKGYVVGDYFVGNATKGKFGLTDLVFEDEEIKKILNDNKFLKPLSDVFLVTIRENMLYMLICDLSNLPINFLDSKNGFENNGYYVSVIQL